MEMFTLSRMIMFFNVSLTEKGKPSEKMCKKIKFFVKNGLQIDKILCYNILTVKCSGSNHPEMTMKKINIQIHIFGGIKWDFGTRSRTW